MSNTTKPKRPYHRITAAQMAKFKALELLHGNGSQAVRDLTPHIKNVGDRATSIRKKAEGENTNDFIDSRLQQIGASAVNRLDELVNSIDEKVATRNVHYAIDHIRGQSVRRSESKHLEMTIEAVLTDD